MRGSLEFLRGVYHIPASVRVSWCIIEDTVSAKYRLGVMLFGYDKAIDVAERRFFQYGTSGKQVYAAKRFSDGDEFVFEDELGHQLRLPKTYVCDIYFRCIYTPEMMNCDLI